MGDSKKAVDFEGNSKTRLYSSHIGSLAMSPWLNEWLPPNVFPHLKIVTMPEQRFEY